MRIIQRLGSISFALVFPVALSIFHGEDTTQLAASAVWAAAVPEPGIWALLIAGLGVVALQARHSKRR